MTDTYPDTPGFKRRGTSEDAAASMDSIAATHRARALEILRGRQMTPDEIAHEMDESVLAIRPRISELKATGDVIEVGERRRNVSGKQAEVVALAAEPRPAVIDFDKIVPLKTRKKKASVKKNALDDAERGCAYCPLQATWENLKHPQISVRGPRTADILILGEAPGREEDEEGRNFIGSAGRLLRKNLPLKHRDRYAMVNAARCRPEGNRNPTAIELHACSSHLEADIAAGQYKAILGLGSVPLSRFLDETTITAVHGLKFPVKIGEKVLWYYPTLHPSFILYTGDTYSPMLPILQNDIDHFFKKVDEWKKPVIEPVSVENVVCAYTEDIARHVCNKMLKAGKPVGFDIETNGLRPNVVGADILSAGVSNGAVSVAWPVHHPQAPNTWGLPLLLEMAQQLRWIAHNAAFELAWLREFSSFDWEPTQGFDDSMVAARLYQQREGCLNLGVLTRLYCGVNIKKLSDVDTKNMANVPLPDMLPYNGLDAWGSWRIFNLMAPRLDKTNYQSILETIESVTEMQLLGLNIDQAAAQELHTEWSGRAKAAEARARDAFEVKLFELDNNTEFNIGSGPQVAKALKEYSGLDLPLTAGSLKEGAKQNYSTNEAALAKLDHPLANNVLEYRHAKKMDTTYVEPLLQAPTRFVDKKIHPVYSTVLTKTLRLSCEDPNAQNFPSRKDRTLRRPIVPPPGCIWASADYGQLEARVYGMASQDRVLCDELIGEVDIHSYWLDVILREYPPYFDRLVDKTTAGATDAQVRKSGRDTIKSDFVFASFFGAAARPVSERTGIPIDIVTEILTMFWERYAGAHRWLRERRREYFLTARTSNLCGVSRYGIMQGNEPINYPIQSTAARLVLESQNEMYQLYKQQRDVHLMPRLNIHDDLMFALPDDDELIETYMQEISKVLVRVRFPWQIVPLKVEWKVGTNWAELSNVYNHTGEYARSGRS